MDLRQVREIKGALVLWDWLIASYFVPYWDVIGLLQLSSRDVWL